MLSSHEVAKILNVPLLAIGQLVFEGKLNPIAMGGEFLFTKDAVQYIKNEDFSNYR